MQNGCYHWILTICLNASQFILAYTGSVMAEALASFFIWYLDLQDLISSGAIFHNFMESLMHVLEIRCEPFKLVKVLPRRKSTINIWTYDIMNEDDAVSYSSNF